MCKTMKNALSQYYSLSVEEILEIWSQGFFVPDTNVLLNLYRYSSTTRKALFQTLEDLGDQLWIPYQVGYEYHLKRLDVISGQAGVYRKIKEKITKLKVEFGTHRKHPFLSTGLFNHFQKIEEELNDRQEKLEKLIQEDPILERLTKVFDGKVGDSYSEEGLEEVFREGARRYEEKIPPGYEDTKKEPKGRKFGDLILWKQTIDKARIDKRPIVFITGDRKEDWWQIHHGRTVGPRPELIAEMTAKAEAKVLFYMPDKFMEYYEEYKKESIDAEVINEIRDLATERARQNKEMVLKKLLIKIPPDARNIFEQAQDAEAAWEKLSQLGIASDADLKRMYDDAEKAKEAFEAYKQLKKLGIDI